jgi:hypothetical protein
MEMKKEKIKELSKEQMADVLLHFIYISQLDHDTLTIEEQGQTEVCEAKDFYNIVNIDIMDIDEDEESFVECKYINSNTVILKYDNRIIQITK